MVRRILITTDEAPVFLANDPSSAVEKLASTLADQFEASASVRKGRQPPSEFVQALRGKGDYFDYLESAGVPVTPMMLVEAAAVQSDLSFELTVFDFGPNGRSGEPVAAYDLSQIPSPAGAMLSAVEAIYENSTWKDRKMAHLGRNLDDIVSPTDEDMVRLPASKVLAGLRLHQEMFGPPEGHPFRVIPAPTENEVPSKVLKGIRAAAIERVEEALANIEWSPPKP